MNRVRSPGSLKVLIALKMKHCQRGFFIFLISFAVASPSTRAEESAGLGAHVHGLSALTIAMEGGNLEIRLTSPAMDIVGFEYKARSAKDIVIVENASLTLHKHQAMFFLEGGECDDFTTRVDIASLLENDHGHENENENENENEHDDSGRHREIVASYTYRCKNLDSLSSIKVFLFKAFPGIHSLQVMWIGPAKQGAATLTPNDSLIEFK